MTDGSKQITENPTASEIPTTAGMTTKVVKGSMWTLAGQIAPLAVSLFTTPFTIRLLGAEGYGVLILIGLIPTYLGFADFGMGMASTKFGSEAYAEGNAEKEAKIVRTAALIALCTSVPVAALLIAFAGPIIGLFNVPVHLQGEAVAALRIISVTFVINFLCGIFNTPQLARLRMDINTIITAVPRMLGIIATPAAIWLGYGLIGAVSAQLAAALMTLAGHIFFSRRLLPTLSGIEIDRHALRPLVQYGGPLVLTLIAAALLINSEKLILAFFASVRDLGYYAVAFNFAGMITLISQSMLFVLTPAFSQLNIPERRTELFILYSRSIKFNYAIILPLFFFMAVIAEPLFTIWAGPDFGKNSIVPFYILLIGYFLNLLAYVSQALLLATGKTHIIAKLNWIELIFYIVILLMLASGLGIIGAALAWTIRVGLDCFVVIFLANKFENAPIELNKWAVQILASSLLLSPALIMYLLTSFSMIIPLLFLISCVTYSIFVWYLVLNSNEQEQLKMRVLSRVCLAIERLKFVK